MAKNRKKKPGNPLKVLIPLALLLAVLTAAAFIIPEKIDSIKQAQLEALVTEAEDYNRTQDEQYAIQLAEFEAENSDTVANQAWPEPETNTGWYVMDLTNYPVAGNGTRTISRGDAMNAGMLLVNQWHSRPVDFDETGLQSVGTYTKGSIQVTNYSVRLFPAAIDALKDALAGAAEEGFTHYLVSEGYRSYDDQNQMFQAKVTKLKGNSKYANYTEAQLIDLAKREVNYPGTSEYNSGLAFSMRLYDKNDANVGAAKYSTTEAAAWMNAHCWEYGLIFRFPCEDFPAPGTIDKSYKTGVSAKLNLYRYVGKGNAAAMHVMDLCMEEYLDYLAEHRHIALFEDGRLRYEIAREYVGDAETLRITTMGKARNATYSLDNMGYLITVYEY